jgi:hypothetical protein
MHTDESIRLPGLFAQVSAEAFGDFRDFVLVRAIEESLGVSFEPDREGHYEEANALVSRPFGYTLAVYREEERMSVGYPASGWRLVVLIHTRISPYAFGLTYEAVDTQEVRLSTYLAHVLTMKTAYRFHAYPFAGSTTEPPEMEIPLLNAAIQAPTPQSPTAYLAPVCQAPGVPTARLQPVPGTPGNEQQHGATLLGHTLRFVLTESALSVDGVERCVHLFLIVLVKLSSGLRQ